MTGSSTLVGLQDKKKEPEIEVATKTSQWYHKRSILPQKMYWSMTNLNAMGIVTDTKSNGTENNNYNSGNQLKPCHHFLRLLELRPPGTRSGWGGSVYDHTLLGDVGKIMHRGDICNYDKNGKAPRLQSL